MAAFSCMYCSFKTPRKCDFKMHLKTKHKEPKISCSFCNLNFNSVPGYKSHQIRKHTDPDKVKVFTCKYFSYSPTLACSFSLHMKKHYGKMIHCDQYDYQCNRNKQIIAHHDSKHETNEYKCKTCYYIGYHFGVCYQCASFDYKATKTSNLRSHERTIHSKKH